MTKEQFQGALRHVLTFAAGIAVSKGIMDDQTAIQISGGVVALAGFIWSWRSKKA